MIWCLVYSNWATGWDSRIDVENCEMVGGNVNHPGAFLHFGKPNTGVVGEVKCDWAIQWVLRVYFLEIETSCTCGCCGSCGWKEHETKQFKMIVQIYQFLWAWFLVNRLVRKLNPVIEQKARTWLWMDERNEWFLRRNVLTNNPEQEFPLTRLSESTFRWQNGRFSRTYIFRMIHLRTGRAYNIIHLYRHPLLLLPSTSKPVGIAD